MYPGSEIHWEDQATEENLSTYITSKTLECISSCFCLEKDHRMSEVWSFSSTGHLLQLVWREVIKISSKKNFHKAWTATKRSQLVHSWCEKPGTPFHKAFAWIAWIWDLIKDWSIPLTKWSHITLKKMIINQTIVITLKSIIAFFLKDWSSQFIIFQRYPWI